ncbi:hypothetical protein [Streptomyces sp. NPDC096324]|uniref:transmembrane-type terpene cyclase n=1 Tax=Streptomyces sp. NPDC096324 TaxID=3366085 RepID=UPI003824B67B
MFSAILIMGGNLWYLTYILIIRASARDRTLGMPLVAVAINLCWEFTFTFIEPYPLGFKWSIIIWFCLDLVIVYQTLRYGPAQFPRLSQRAFYAIFGLTVCLALPLVLAVNHAFNDAWGLHSAYFDNLAFSAMFIAMLYSRGSSKGQSVGIAASKLLGTALMSLAFALHPDVLPHSPLLWILWGSCLVLDTVYLVALSRVCAAERRAAGAEKVWWWARIGQSVPSVQGQTS